MKGIASLLLAAVVGIGGCSLLGSRPRDEGSWVLVRSPTSGDLGIPIYAWERVQRFPSAEECSNYRAELLSNAVSAASRPQLEDVYRLHCMPMKKMTPPR